ncbi:MAG: glutamate-1-semialdehyde 2,1-aminomutase [Bdellovibrionaceae bacterium]|nr:glutamate-1-semialdehyde 2,1-aminomutase [Pseudobdellovibrionaceae bacterium]
MKSEELFNRALKIAPGGVHSPVRGFQNVGGHPVFFKSAKGATLVSVEGDEYLDFCQSFGPLILGHQDEDVKQAVHEMIDTIWTSGTCEPYSLELAETIKELASPVVEKLRFVSSGTEAVMSALRVARGATKKDKVIKFEGCYHGHVDSLLVKAGSGLADGAAASDSAGVSLQTAAQTLVLPLDDEKAFRDCVDAHKDEVAAVILEPLPANFGLLIQRQEFVEYVASYAKKNGILVIFDEVISGFRMGFGGMARILGIQPDLVTYGKVLGGGFPVGCYGGRAELMDLVAPSGPVYQAGTLSASPVGMAAGLAQLKKMQRLNIHDTLEARGAQLERGFNSIAQSKGWNMRMLRQGSLFWFADTSKGALRRVDQIPTDHKSFYKYFFKGLMSRRLYMAPSGFEVGFIGYAHTQDVIERAIGIFVDAMDEALGKA